MLLARLGMAEIAIIREIHENVCALFRELPDQIGKSRFVADEHSKAVTGGRQNLDVVARDEIASLLGDPIDEGEERRHEFAERHEIDFVVAAHLRPSGPSRTAEFSGWFSSVYATVPNRK